MEGTDASLTQSIYQQKTMETAQALKRQRKDELINKLLEATKTTQEHSERVLAAAVIGGVVGFIVGVGW